MKAPKDKLCFAKKSAGKTGTLGAQSAEARVGNGMCFHSQVTVRISVGEGREEVPISVAAPVNAENTTLRAGNRTPKAAGCRIPSL